MKQLKKIFFLFILLFKLSILNAQVSNDSISEIAIQDFYRYNFSSFDSIKRVGDVVYLAPV